MGYWIRMLFTKGKLQGEAFVEVLIVALFSLIPFAISHVFKLAGNSSTKLHEIGYLFSKGQLYLLVAGMFGSVFWLAFVKSECPKNNVRTGLGVVAFVLMVPVFGIIAYDPTSSSLANENLIYFSYWHYACFLLLYYLLVFYSRLEPRDPRDVLNDGKISIKERYERMTENGN